MKHTGIFLRACALALTTGIVATASAHTVWLEPAAREGRFDVKFGGHAGAILSYDPAKLGAVEALDATGKALPVQRETRKDGVTLQVQGRPALIAVHFDNGIHTRPARGPTVEKPMNEVPGARSATHAVKYHKTILDWSPLVNRPLQQPFEVVPLSATRPRAGTPLRVRILKDGKPIAGVKVGAGEEPGEGAPVSNADGVVEFVPAKGFNRLWAGHRSPVQNEPRFTELSYEYSLGFWAQ